MPIENNKTSREAQLARDVALIRRSIQQFKDGKGQEVNEFFDGLHSKLLAMQAKKKGKAE